MVHKQQYIGSGILSFLLKIRGLLTEWYTYYDYSVVF